ncbi:hypothetical protein AB8Z38_22915 [Bradyrhizobium sp. LLZ17]|uniref:Lipoprotein n=1 Tax=Bradyrhizobium sp. LLZ17 TaxID=3239388 RepID=A0AB39XDZ6_9BRAD
MRRVYIVCAAMLLACSSTSGYCDDWATAQDGSAAVVADGARLNVVCDTDHGRALHPDSLGKILIFLKEPVAAWRKLESVEVRTRSDTGSQSANPPSHGTALSSTSLVLEDDATWELSVMGAATKSFTLIAGGHARTFSAINLRATVSPVLGRCGDHW